MKRIVFSGCILIAIITSCTGMKTFNGNSDLNGAVYDCKNRPVSGCIILLDGVEKTISDTNGRFRIPNMNCGTYSIETKSSYCEGYKGNIQFLNETQYLLITVVDSESLYELLEESITVMNIEKAEKQVYRLLAINKNDSNAIMYLAVLRYREENYDAALRLLRDAQRRGINDIWIGSLAEKIEEKNGKS